MLRRLLSLSQIHIFQYYFVGNLKQFISTRIAKAKPIVKFNSMIGLSERESKNMLFNRATQTEEPKKSLKMTTGDLICLKTVKS